MKRIALKAIDIATQLANALLRAAFRQDVIPRERVRVSQAELDRARWHAAARLGVCVWCSQPSRVLICADCVYAADDLGLDPQTLRARGGIEA